VPITTHPELLGLKLKALTDCFEGDNLGDDYYDVVAELIRRHGGRGNRFLVKQLRKLDPYDEDRLRALLLVLTLAPVKSLGDKPLSQQERKFVRKKLRVYLGDDRPMILCQAIDGWLRLGKKKPNKRIEGMIIHKSEFVRCSVLRYLAKRNPAVALPLLIIALEDESHYVRTAAIDEIAGLQNPELIPHLQALLTHSDERVRQDAQETILFLESLDHLNQDLIMQYRSNQVVAG
jgi:hypothetical protein